jgi:fatty acid desaturase
MEGSVLDRTRSFDPGPLGRLLMWNMPFHAEHHAYPAVPFHALPRLHEALAAHLPHRAGGVLGLHLRGGRAPQAGSGSTTSA